MMRRATVLAFVVGCGGVETAETDAPVAVDAPVAIDAPDPVDAPIDAPMARCNPTAAFEQPAAVAGVNTASVDASPFLSADERTIYFASGRPGGMGGLDIYIATRASPTGTFDTPALVAGVNSADVEGRPVLTDDGRSMYAEIRRGANPYRIERATRGSTSESFGAMGAVAALGSAANDVAPTITPDGTTIYFVSGRGGNADVWRAMGTDGNFGTPALASGTNLSTTSGEDYPAVAPDDRSIFVASDRAGGAGASDIWFATRPNVAQGFGQPVNLAAVNTVASEWPGWVTADGCVLYFTRDIGSGNLDLFVARRGM